jgi:hypothetical protein
LIKPSKVSRPHVSRSVLRERSDLAQVELKSDGLPAHRLNLPGCDERFIRAVLVSQDDISPAFRDAGGHITAEAPASSGDECEFVHVVRLAPGSIVPGIGRRNNPRLGRTLA